MTVRMSVQGFAVLLLLVVVCFAGCGKEGTGSSGGNLPEVTVDLRRLDVGLANLSKSESMPACQQVYKEQLAADRHLIGGWMLQENTSIFDTVPEQFIDSLLSVDLCMWAQNPNSKMLLDSLHVVWPADADLAGRLKPALQGLKKHLPALKQPPIRTMAWGFNPQQPWEQQFMTDRFYITNEAWGIGLDYFSGDRFLSLHPEMPKYVRMRCRPEVLPSALLDIIFRSQMPPMSAAQMPTLLDRMLYAGIRLHAIERCLPDLPDSLLMSWTSEQMKMVETHEAELYSGMVGLLFEQNPQKYDWAMREGPFTQRLGRDYPARLGEYIGLQMVRRYVEEHPDVKLSFLLGTTLYKPIFDASGYKPEK